MDIIVVKFHVIREQGMHVFVRNLSLFHPSENRQVPVIPSTLTERRAKVESSVVKIRPKNIFFG